MCATHLTSVFFSAAYFEKGDQENCRKDCQQAVDVGREIRADYKLIAK